MLRDLLVSPFLHLQAKALTCLPWEWVITEEFSGMPMAWAQGPAWSEHSVGVVTLAWPEPGPVGCSQQLTWGR